MMALHYPKRIPRWIVAPVMLYTLSALVAAGQTPEPARYDLEVRINPSAGHIVVRGRVEVPRQVQGPQRFKFSLHETFVIRKLRVNGNATQFSYVAAQPTPLTPASRTVSVALPPQFPPGKLWMDIDYEGRLKKLPEFGASPDDGLAMDDQINSHLVELAGYSSWYPQFLFGAPLQVRLEVSLPNGWMAVCSGKRIARRLDNGRVVTRWSSPRDMDILIVASPNFKVRTVHEAGANIQVYYTQMPKQFIDQEVRQIAAVVKLYTDVLGETNIPANTVKHVYSPKRYGQGKAGIARPGMIVTSEGLTLAALAKDPHFSLFQEMAHEIAHFWWSFGVGQGDWINESFAEYFSAVAVEKLEGKEMFKGILSSYGKQVKDLPPQAPPLATVPFVNDDVGFVVRYYEGSMMLNQFRGAMGDSVFFEACRVFFQSYRGKPVGTSEFRSFWRQRMQPRSDLVDLWLDSSGGAPTVRDTPAAR